MSKWIVAGNMEYYPWIDEYDTYEEAKKAYDEQLGCSQHTIYLAEVKESKKD